MCDVSPSSVKLSPKKQDFDVIGDQPAFLNNGHRNTFFRTIKFGIYYNPAAEWQAFSCRRFLLAFALPVCYNNYNI